MGRRWDEIKGLVLIWESFRPKGFSSGPGRKRHDVVCADGSRSAPASEKHCWGGFKVRDH